MNSFSAIIADDEAPIRLHLKRTLARLWPELDIVSLAEDGEDAIEKIRRYEPDIAFIDIKMPVYNGLQVAEKVSGSCCVVFITAYDEYAVEAFENEALDYVLKPVDEERLNKTIARLKNRLCDEQHTPYDMQSILDVISAARTQNEPAAYLRWIKTSKQGDTLLISVDDILYFSAGDKYTSVVTRDHEYLIKKSIKNLELELDPNVFWRVHRSTIVNVNCIAVANKMLNGRYTLSLKGSDSSLTVSRNYSYKFKQM